jgi:hypothetical protein
VPKFTLSLQSVTMNFAAGSLCEEIFPFISVFYRGSCTETFFFKNGVRKWSIISNTDGRVYSNVGEPWHIGADSGTDPQIRTSD